MINVYPLVLPHKVKISLEGLHVLCLKWGNRNFICGTFKFLEDKYGGFNRKQERETIGGGWTT